MLSFHLGFSHRAGSRSISQDTFKCLKLRECSHEFTNNNNKRVGDRNKVGGIEEMAAQWVRAQTALPGELTSVPSPVSSGSQLFIIPALWSLMRPLVSECTYMKMVHIPTLLFSFSASQLLPAPHHEVKRFSPPQASFMIFFVVPCPKTKMSSNHGPESKLPPFLLVVAGIFYHSNKKSPLQGPTSSS